MKYQSLWLLLLWSVTGWAEVPKGVQFRADLYQRDLTKNTLRGKGNAWFKTESRELFADEIEIDFGTNEGVANGNVRLSDTLFTIWANHGTFHLKDPQAQFEKATLTMGQMVLTGNTVRRLDEDDFEVEEGTYSNCNTGLIDSPTIGGCPLDWKLSGRRFRLTLEGYAHFYDVLMQSRNLPVLYAPYIVVPIKTKRQSGFLFPSINATATLGTGITLPLFLALGDWHDLLLNTTRYSNTGIHLGAQYRYIYSPTRHGNFNFFLANRRFGPNSNPGPDDTSRPLTLGLFGEGAISAHNVFKFENSRAHSRQMISYVSNPYFTYDYAIDVGPRASLGNLRSQLTFTYPGDHWLFTGQAQYLQSLIISKDSGVDQGGVAQLPALSASRATSSFWGKLFSYELDTQFTNFYRAAGGVDQVPDSPVTSGVNTDTNPAFDANDYVRTGRRLQVEPRLIANLPMPPGFQFQPLVRTGTLLYHFSDPASAVRHREYLDIEIPIAMQLSRTFDTPFSSFEKINHTFQPRFIYAQSLLQTGGNDHPFFMENASSPGLSNPRFDTIDRITPFQYMRMELINRFQRRTDSGGTERFFWFQVSEQVNLITSTTDPRYKTRLGPIEIFSALQLGRFSLQLQANYPLELTRRAGFAPVREAAISLGASLKGRGNNSVSVNGLYRDSIDSAGQRAANIHFYQALATFFDLEGFLEYNFLTREIYAWRLGFHFRAKPRSCWSFSLTTGQNEYKNPLTIVGFNLDLGAGGG
ncbi:hypothetical protein K2X33_05085 [bacterium]|nr:hypothetical protein [bacterium]